MPIVKGEAFPKTARLRFRREFLKLGKYGKRRVGSFFIIEALESPQERGRIGLTVTRRYGKAHERNRIKRLLREAFRRNRSQFTGLDIHLIPRKRALEASYDQLCEELAALVRGIT